MDLSLNSDLVEYIFNTENIMIVKGNGVTLAFIHKAKVPRYKQYVWFRKNAITNIMNIKTLLNNIK